MSDLKTPSEFLDRFASLYKDKVGEFYLRTYGRDQKILKDLLSQIGEDRLEACLRAYFDRNEKIYSPVYFKVAINDLMQITRREKKEILKNEEEDRFL